jgi:probable F420-dependent oxidoreductase
MIRFGVFIFATDYAIGPAELAIAVEACGLDSLFVPDHSHVPTSSKPLWRGDGELPRHFSHTYDPFVALGACAAVTTDIRLGTAVCLVSQRDPITLAKAVASLDMISDGRVIFGAAGGWNRQEMENHGTPFKQRWNIVRERILAMKTIWSEQEPEFHGEFVEFDPIWSHPKPIQTGGPPVWIGSHSRSVPGRVADYADGWMPVNGRYAGDAPADLKSACAQRNRAFDEVTMALFDAPLDEAQARGFIDQGYSDLIFVLPSAQRDVVLPKLEEIAVLAGRLRS